MGLLSLARATALARANGNTQPPASRGQGTSEALAGNIVGAENLSGQHTALNCHLPWARRLPVGHRRPAAAWHLGLPRHRRLRHPAPGLSTGRRVRWLPPRLLAPRHLLAHPWEPHLPRRGPPLQELALALAPAQPACPREGLVLCRGLLPVSAPPLAAASTAAQTGPALCRGAPAASAASPQPWAVLTRGSILASGSWALQTRVTGPVPCRGSPLASASSAQQNRMTGPALCQEASPASASPARRSPPPEGGESLAMILRQRPAPSQASRGQAERVCLERGVG